jgi:hypothetical protein
MLVLLLLVGVSIPLAVAVVILVLTPPSKVPKERDVIYIPYEQTALLIDAPETETPQ